MQKSNNVILKNYTPHPICIIKNAKFDPETRSHYGGEVFKEIPSSGRVSAWFKNSWSIRSDGIPEMSKELTGLDVLPEGEPNEQYLVSRIYVDKCIAAGMDVSNLRIPGPAVYRLPGGKGGKIGCLGIIKPSQKRK